MTTNQNPATSYFVLYSCEDGAQATHTFTTLADASAYASDMVYTLSGEQYAGFPAALDTYPVQGADGVNHTVTVTDTLY